MTNPLLGKIFPQRGLRNHLSTIIEVGFNLHGPTLALSGTLLALSKVMFVYNIGLHVLHKNRKYEAHFNWFAFRPHKFTAGGYKGNESEMPAKFMITAEKPHEYNILFFDQERYARFNPFIKNLKEGWRMRLENNALSAQPQNYQSLFKSFFEDRWTKGIVEELQRMNYWQAGEYVVKMVVLTQDVQHRFETTRTFTLDETDAKGFAPNTLMIVHDVCKQPNIFYHFAFPELKE